SVQFKDNLRNSRAGERATGPVDDLIGEPLPGGSPVDFDLVVRRHDEPALFDARAGVSAEFGAIIVEAGYADFDDKFGCVGVFQAEFLLTSPDDGEVGFGLRVRAGNGLF